MELEEIEEKIKTLSGAGKTINEQAFGFACFLLGFRDFDKLLLPKLIKEHYKGDSEEFLSEFWMVHKKARKNAVDYDVIKERAARSDYNPPLSEPLSQKELKYIRACREIALSASPDPFYITQEKMAKICPLSDKTENSIKYGTNMLKRLANNGIIVKVEKHVIPRNGKGGSPAKYKWIADNTNPGIVIVEDNVDDEELPW